MYTFSKLGEYFINISKKIDECVRLHANIWSRMCLDYTHFIIITLWIFFQWHLLCTQCNLDQYDWPGDELCCISIECITGNGWKWQNTEYNYSGNCTDFWYLEAFVFIILPQTWCYHCIHQYCFVLWRPLSMQLTTGQSGTIITILRYRF